MTSSLPAKRPLLYLITEGHLTDDHYEDLKSSTLEKVRDSVDLGVDLVQVREKSLSARNLLDLSKQLRKICLPKVRLLINDRFDIALAAEADGVHLTETSLPVEVVRAAVDDRLLIGCSRHTVEGVKEARAGGADFAVLGPVFPTPGKGEPLGLERFKEACKAAKGFPVIGLGGMNAENASAVVKAGAAGIAAIRFLNDRHALANFKW